jgi:hypothetical protein
MKRIATIEKKKAELYRMVKPLVPRELGEDLELLAVHSERNAKLLGNVEISDEPEELKRAETALNFLEKSLLDPNATVEDYYRYAIDAERALTDLYRLLSSRAKSKKTRKIFGWLAEIGEEHVRILKRHLDMLKFMEEEGEMPDDLTAEWSEDVEL